MLKERRKGLIVKKKAHISIELKGSKKGKITLNELKDWEVKYEVD